MEDLQLTIELKKADTLRELFPKEGIYNHVSLTLIGKMGDDDFNFLCGYSKNLKIDEDTGEFLYIREIFMWNTIDLNLSKTDPDSFNAHKITEIPELRDLVLPIGYKEVHIYKFSWENDTTRSIVISEGSKEIKEDSFIKWKSLEKVSFPSSLEKIAPEAFVGCNLLQSFEFPEGSEHFMICDGVLFSPDKTILIAFPPGLEIEKYEIPQGTTLIAERAFKQNPFIKEITIPKTVVNIQAYAFEACSSLEKIEVDSANPIYYSKDGILFERSRAVLIPHEEINCNRHSDVMICIPAAFDRPRIRIKKSFLEAKCFSGCKNIKTVTYDCGFYSHRIDGAFDNCPEIEEISLTNVEILPRLIGCQKLKKLNIEGKFLGNLYDAIIKNDELKEVNINNCSDYYTIDGVVFNKDHELIYYPTEKKDEKYVVPKDTHAIGFWVFNHNPHLRTVVLPSSFDLRKLKEEWLIDDDSDNDQSFTYHPFCEADVIICLDGGKDTSTSEDEEGTHR